jgi:hypothetical protein
VDTEPIPQEELKAAALRFCRRIATSLVQAMAESGMTYAQIEKRVGHKKGWAKALVLDLIDGSAGSRGIDDIADFLLAQGFEPFLTIEPKADPDLPSAPASGRDTP